MFLEIAAHAAVVGAFEAFGHRNELTNSWKRIADRLTKGKISIIVIGPGGAGKSTLSQFFCEPSAKIPPSKYKESLFVERLDLPGIAAAEIITAPGQERHSANLDDILDGMKRKNKRFGLINVVSYGFHSTNIGIDTLRKSQQTTESATNEYLSKCRLREIEIINHLSEKIKRHNNPFWMITLATKQDLWWSDRANIKRHYMSGDYAKAIEKIASQHTASGFNHSFFSMAVHSQNFCDENGDIIRPTSSGYDDIIKYAHQKELLEIVWTYINPKK